MLNSPSQQIPSVISISSSSKAILKVLCYFQIFKYPLRLEEIYAALPIKMSHSDLETELALMIEQSLIFQKEAFYFIGDDETIVERRKKGNLLAAVYLKRASRIGRIISQFPFVRGIYISGSLSKGFMDSEGDIDYFVVTKPGYLWMVKGSLAFIKKVFLLNSKKYFCFNYFVDDQSLEIPDRNVFTAIELTHLIPVYNTTLYQQMLQKNQWVFSYLPNAQPADPQVEYTDGKLKRGLEIFYTAFLGRFFDTINRKLFEIFWTYKYREALKDTDDLRVRCYKNVSKIHPNNFQEKVLIRLNDELLKFERKHNVSLIEE